MAPKPSVMREDILKVGLDIVRRDGSDGLNARNIAKELKCSTKPLFRIYENMDDLKEDIYCFAVENFQKNVKDVDKKEVDGFVQMGINYVKFAALEKDLFKYIFLNGDFIITGYNELMTKPEMVSSIKYLEHLTGLSIEKTRDLYIGIWLYIHGLATLFATNPMDYDELKINKLITENFSIRLSHIKTIN